MVGLCFILGWQQPNNPSDSLPLSCYSHNLNKPLKNPKIRCYILLLLLFTQVPPAVPVLSLILSHILHEVCYTTSPDSTPVLSALQSQCERGPLLQENSSSPVWLSGAGFKALSSSDVVCLIEFCIFPPTALRLIFNSLIPGVHTGFAWQT